MVQMLLRVKMNNDAIHVTYEEHKFGCLNLIHGEEPEINVLHLNCKIGPCSCDVREN